MLQNPQLGSRQQEQQGHNEGVILSRPVIQTPDSGRGKKHCEVGWEDWWKKATVPTIPISLSVSQTANESCKEVRKTNHSWPQMWKAFCKLQSDSMDGWEPWGPFENLPEKECTLEGDSGPSQMGCHVGTRGHGASCEHPTWAASF